MSDVQTGNSGSGYTFFSGAACYCQNPWCSAYHPNRSLVYGSPFYSPSPLSRCEHCWCRREEIDAKTHKTCCMCATRTLLVS